MGEFQKDPKAAESKYTGKVVEVRGWYWGSKFGDGTPPQVLCVYLRSFVFPYRCAFWLDGVAMGTRMLVLQIDGMQTMKGRFEGVVPDGERGDTLLQFQECVPGPSVLPNQLPVEASAEADVVVAALESDDLQERSGFVGRKITVSGAIASVERNGSVALVVLGNADRRGVKCIVENPDFEALATLKNSGKPVKATGWLRTSIQSALIGICLHETVIE